MKNLEEKNGEKTAEKPVAKSNGKAVKTTENGGSVNHENESKSDSGNGIAPMAEAKANPAVQLGERIKNIRDVNNKIAHKELLEEALKEISRFSPNGNSDIRVIISNGVDNWSTSNTVILEETLKNLKDELSKKITVFEGQILEMSI